ncbi:MAG: GGDEF domain-containing protein [Gammaproteobacteria bacterium]|nr:GGDEF domain-containing protein [Gammaproteobacteria bacterium]
MVHTDHGEHFKKLENELKQREYEIQLLTETTQAIGSQLELEKVLEIIAKRARVLINSETLLIPILNKEFTEYTYSSGDGANIDEIIGETLPLDFGVCGWVWRNRKAWWRGVLDELSDEERNKWENEAGTLIMVPLMGRDTFLGGIAGINKVGGGEFTENDLHILKLFAGQVAIAIENAMAMEKLEEAKRVSEAYQEELNSLNKRLVSVNNELEHLTLYDQLTGLPNRLLFRDRLQQDIYIASQQDLFITIMIIDIDRFKEINEALGHEEGDKLLKEISDRFIRIQGSKGTLARLSGDEFAVLMINANNDMAIEQAQVFLDILEEPVQLANENVSVTAKIGITQYPEHGDDVHTLLKHMDAAIIAAKRSKESIHVYQPEKDDTTGRLVLYQNIRQAFEQSEFLLYYQPKIELVSGIMTGVEALARWPDQNNGYVPTEMFISVMEQTGMINEFSYWALDTAMSQRVEWLREGMDLNISVNIPVTMLLENSFVSRMQSLLEQHNDVGGITLEITENIFFSDYDRLSRLMNELQDLGFSFSIDDFGTGHSSLSRLRLLPVSEIKIDKSFVMDMCGNKDDEMIVKSTIELAHNLGIQICAEGVETSAVLQQLNHWRCDNVQGYCISKAMPAVEIKQFIKRSLWIVATTMPNNLYFDLEINE